MKKYYLLLSLIFFIGLIVKAQDKKESKQLKPDKEGYYLYVPTMPELIGSMDDLAHKVVYPESEKAKGIQGQVYVTTYINEKGEVEKTSITKSVNAVLDKAALDAVNTTKWKPGYIEGKPVKVKISIPIKFKLDEDKGITNTAYESAKHMLETMSEYNKDVDKEPEPIGGMGSIMNLIKYPEQEMKSNIEGKVFIKAYVDENGNVTMATNIPQDNKNFINAATSAIKKSKFIPAEKNGKKVKSIITIPIQFKLK